jgi:Tol biopolymer transport system component
MKSLSVSLSLLIIAFNLMAACNGITVERTEMQIPLALNPSTTTLKPGDQVVISVISNEWQEAELTWKASSEIRELDSPDSLSSTTGPAVVYTAPEVSGEVTISVIGTTQHSEGHASVSLNIISSIEQGRLAIVRRSEVDKLEIFAMDLKNGGERQVTVTPGNNWSWAPSWSPDGSLIALSWGTPARPEVRVVPVSGGIPESVSGISDEQPSSQPTWSPDGQSIMFQSSHNGNWQLYRLNLEEATTEQLTWGGTSKYIPTWSPTRDEALFASRVEDTQRIFRLHLDTKKIVQLSYGASEDYAPSWSPDGNWIAFQTEEGRQVGNSEIYIMDRQGANRQRVTHTPEDKWSRAPTWSPDGQWLAYVANIDESIGDDFGDLYVINVHTGEIRRLTFGGKVYDWRISWAMP